MKISLKNIHVLFAVIVIALLSSCSKDFLNRTPYTSLPVDVALSTEGDLQVALRGAYAGLRAVVNQAGTTVPDLYGRTIPVLGDVMADNAYVSVQNSNRYVLYNTYSISVSDANADGLWASAYNVILRCNNIINSSLTGSANINQYKGEALAIRALLYFELVRFFAKPYNDNPASPGVPIVTTYNLTQKPARNTVAEVYTQILNDLTQAYTQMTLYTNSSQFSKYAARALQAKVYLHKGDYANAKTAALDVINNGGFTLVTTANYAAYWSNPAIRTDKVETLFEVSSDAVNNLGFDALGYIYSQSGYGDLLASDSLYALFSSTDIRRSLYATGTRGGLASVFVNKYPSISGDRSDTKVLRLSDVYLIAAEASLPNDTEALTYLNYVVSRRDPSLTYTSTGATLLENIITERRKELAFEGDRFHDLNRLKRPILRSNNYPATARIIPYPDDRRVLPIPQTERDANPAIVQNSGYK